MSSVVIDASVMGPLLLPDEADDEHPALVDVLRVGAAVVPPHWHLEVANMGRSALLRGRLDRAELIAGLDRFSEFEIDTDEAGVAQAWPATVPLALKHGLTPYDAAYLELAMRRDAPLLCKDGSLEQAARAEGVELL